MKRTTTAVLLSCLILTQPMLVNIGWAKTNTPEVETIDNNINIKIYKIKRKADFTAVEIGFTNTSDNYVSFTPKEIYLNDKKKYSVAPIPFDQLQNIETTHKNYGLIPLSLAIALGIGAIGAHEHGNLAEGLALAALGLGGVFVLSEALQNQSENNTLITFKNNSLSNIDKLPPGMTLGGFMYFPKIKQPDSITVVVSKNGHFEKKNFKIK